MVQNYGYGVATSDFEHGYWHIRVIKDIEMFQSEASISHITSMSTPRENRIGKMHGSVVLSFNNKEMHQISLRDKLFVSGVNCHTRNSGKPSLLTDVLTATLWAYSPYLS